MHLWDPKAIMGLGSKYANTVRGPAFQASKKEEKIQKYVNSILMKKANPDWGLGKLFQTPS